MIAGTLGILASAAEDPLENENGADSRAIDIEVAHTYLDDELTIQSGQIAGPVEKEDERVHVNGYDIETERVDVRRTVASEFVSDVDGEGWILAERTHPSDDEHEPEWPFNQLEIATGRQITPMSLKPWEFVRNQMDAGRTITPEMATKQFGDDTSIEWGKGATKDAARDGDVGVALTTHWRDQFVRLVIYQSGYLAIWEPSEMNPELLGRFIHEEILPIAYIEDEDETEQDTLEESGEGEESEPGICEECSRESESVEKTVVNDGSVSELCITCRDYFYENGELPSESEDPEQVEA